MEQYSIQMQTYYDSQFSEWFALLFHKRENQCEGKHREIGGSKQQAHTFQKTANESNYIVRSSGVLWGDVSLPLLIVTPMLFVHGWLLFIKCTWPECFRVCWANMEWGFRSVKRATKRVSQFRIFIFIFTLQRLLQKTMRFIITSTIWCAASWTPPAGSRMLSARSW